MAQSEEKQREHKRAQLLTQLVASPDYTIVRTLPYHKPGTCAQHIEQLFETELLRLKIADSLALEQRLGIRVLYIRESDLIEQKAGKGARQLWVVKTIGDSFTRKDYSVTPKGCFTASTQQADLRGKPVGPHFAQKSRVYLYNPKTERLEDVDGMVVSTELKETVASLPGSVFKPDSRGGLTQINPEAIAEVYQGRAVLNIAPYTVREDTSAADIAATMQSVNYFLSQYNDYPQQKIVIMLGAAPDEVCNKVCAHVYEQIETKKSFKKEVLIVGADASASALPADALKFQEKIAALVAMRRIVPELKIVASGTRFFGEDTYHVVFPFHTPTPRELGHAIPIEELKEPTNCALLAFRGSFQDPSMIFFDGQGAVDQVPGGLVCTPGSTLHQFFCAVSTKENIAQIWGPRRRMFDGYGPLQTRRDQERSLKRIKRELKETKPRLKEALEIAKKKGQVCDYIKQMGELLEKCDISGPVADDLLKKEARETVLAVVLAKYMDARRERDEAVLAYTRLKEKRQQLKNQKRTLQEDVARIEEDLESKASSKATQVQGKQDKVTTSPSASFFPLPATLASSGPSPTLVPVAGATKELQPAADSSPATSTSTIEGTTTPSTITSSTRSLSPPR